MKVQPDKLHIEWLDPKWAEWKELHESVEIKTLIEAASKKIAQAGESDAKGKGKGKITPAMTSSCWTQSSFGRSGRRKDSEFSSSSSRRRKDLEF